MDAAFRTAKFPGYTTSELHTMSREIGAKKFTIENANANEAIQNEIVRRGKVESGDVSVMTDGERLRFIKTGKAR